MGAAPVIVVLAVMRGAIGLPAVGSVRPNVVMVDSWDRGDELAFHDGQPMLLLYEDRGSGQLNAAFKRELTEVAQDGRYKSAITFVPVADVSSYDFWPARGFAKRSVQKQALATRTNIICDWDGTLREALGLGKKTSNVVLYDARGRVVFAFAGAMSPEQRATLFALLREQIDATVQRAAP